MPKVTLSDGRTAMVSVKKSTVTIKKISRRRVTATFKVFSPLKEGQERSDIALEISAETTCSEHDQFNPRFGRQESIRRLIKIIGGRITKEDRHLIMQTICPELFWTKVDRLKMEYDRLKKMFEPEDQLKKVV